MAISKWVLSMTAGIVLSGASLVSAPQIFAQTSSQSAQSFTVGSQTGTIQNVSSNNGINRDTVTYGGQTYQGTYDKATNTITITNGSKTTTLNLTSLASTAQSKTNAIRARVNGAGTTKLNPNNQFVLSESRWDHIWGDSYNENVYINPTSEYWSCSATNYEYSETLGFYGNQNSNNSSALTTYQGDVNNLYNAEVYAASAVTASTATVITGLLTSELGFGAIVAAIGTLGIGVSAAAGYITCLNDHVTDLTALSAIPGYQVTSA